VTTELDMFANQEAIRSIRKELASRQGADMADLRSAVTLVTAPGGHGTEYGFPIPTLASANEAQAFVDARIGEGSDYIKIVYDDGKVYGLAFPTLSKETLKGVIAAAHKRGKLAIVHIAPCKEHGMQSRRGRTVWRTCSWTAPRSQTSGGSLPLTTRS